MCEDVLKVNQTWEKLLILRDSQAEIYNIEAVLKDLSEIKISNAEEYQEFEKFLWYIISPALVKDFTGQEKAEYDESDFADILELAPDCFRCLELLFSKLSFDCFTIQHSVEILTALLVLCATHSSESFAWSNKCLVSYVSGIIKYVLNLTNCKSMMELLCSTIARKQSSLFASILLSSRPSLMEDTWNHNPSTSQIFKWLLFHVKHPHLHDYLPSVLPPSLMFIGHYSIYNKILGIECLDHIIENVPPTELKLYGRADVIFDALFRLTYEREAEIVYVLYPCLLRFLSNQMRNIHSSREPRKWNNYDEVYHQLVWNMRIENSLVLRRVYSLQLPEFIKKMGVTVVKHMKKTKEVLLDFLTIQDGPEELTRIRALDSLIVLIEVAWARIEHHCIDILKRLLILVYDMETDDIKLQTGVKEAVIDRCKTCMVLLKRACPMVFKECCLQEVVDMIPELEIVVESHVKETLISH